MKHFFSLNKLPPVQNLETQSVLKSVISTHRTLAELKGLILSFDQPNILSNNFSWQCFSDPLTAKHYQQQTLTALKISQHAWQQNGVLTSNILLDAQAMLNKEQPGLRKTLVTDLPTYAPQGQATIKRLLENLIYYINLDDNMDLLIKMALMHYQFIAIHPFYNYNHHMCNFLDNLFLTHHHLLPIPFISLLQFINATYEQQQNLLFIATEMQDYQAWLMYFLAGLHDAAKQGIKRLHEIQNLRQTYQEQISSHFRFYSKPLIDNLFINPVMTIELLEQDLKISRITATKYLEELAEVGLLNKQKVWRNNFYLNHSFINKVLSA